MITEDFVPWLVSVDDSCKEGSIVQLFLHFFHCFHTFIFVCVHVG